MSDSEETKSFKILQKYSKKYKARQNKKNILHIRYLDTNSRKEREENAKKILSLLNENKQSRKNNTSQTSKNKTSSLLENKAVLFKAEILNNEQDLTKGNNLFNSSSVCIAKKNINPIIDLTAD